MADFILYLRGAGALSTRRAWSGDAAWHPTSGATNSWLLGTAGSAATSVVTNTANGPTEVLQARFISPPLASSFTISSGVGYSLWGSESAMAANASFRIEIWHLKPDGTATSVWGDSNTTELGTTTANRAGTISVTGSETWDPGDCIGVTVSIVDAGGTMASGNSVTLRYDGGTANADGDSYIDLNFNNDPSFVTTDAGGSTCYFTNTAADIDPDTGSSITSKKLQIDGSAPSAWNAVTNTSAGPVSPIHVTASAGGSKIQWLSAPLDAVTLTAGWCELTLDSFVSATGTATTKVEIIAVDNDGVSNPVTLAAAYHGGGAQSSQSMSTSSGGAPYTDNRFSINGYSLPQGGRIKIRLYTDDGLRSAVADFGTLTGGTVMAGGLTTTHEMAACSFKFRDTLTEASTGTTGSAAVSETADTSTATGNFVPVMGYNAVVRGKRVRRVFRASTARPFGIIQLSGTAAASETDDTSTASGTFAPPPISGTATPSETDDTSTASGTFQQNITGTSAATETDDTSAATGTFAAPFQMAFLLQARNRRVRRFKRGSTVRPVGQITFHRGTAAISETDDTSTASGTFAPPPITGSAAATEGDDTSTTSGLFTNDRVGTAAATEDNDTSTASGSFFMAMVVSPSPTTRRRIRRRYRRSTVRPVGQITFYRGSANVTEGSDTMVDERAGTFVPPTTGSANVTEGNDTSTASGLLKFIGTAAIVESNDTSAASGVLGVIIVGTAAVTEQNDQPFISGATPISQALVNRRKRRGGLEPPTRPAERHDFFDVRRGRTEAWFAPTLLNSWVVYDGSHAQPGYRKEGDKVKLRGLVRSGTVGSGTPIFTLPEYHRPSLEMIFAVLSNDALGQVRIYPNGNVSAILPSVNTWVSLDTIEFSVTA